MLKLNLYLRNEFVRSKALKTVDEEEEVIKEQPPAQKMDIEKDPRSDPPPDHTELPVSDQDNSQLGEEEVRLPVLKIPIRSREGDAEIQGCDESSRKMSYAA